MVLGLGNKRLVADKKDINEQLVEVITYGFRHQFVLVVQIEFRNVKDLLLPLGFDLQQC